MISITPGFRRLLQLRGYAVPRRAGRNPEKGIRITIPKQEEEQR